MRVLQYSESLSTIISYVLPVLPLFFPVVILVSFVGTCFIFLNMFLFDSASGLDGGGVVNCHSSELALATIALDVSLDSGTID